MLAFGGFVSLLPVEKEFFSLGKGKKHYIAIHVGKAYKLLAQTHSQSLRAVLMF